MSGARRPCEVRWLGRIDYEEAWQIQRHLAVQRSAGDIPDSLLLLVHPPVYTTGRRNAQRNLLLPPDLLGAPLIETDRGGDITFHGPGQLIAYPIIDLRAAGLSVVAYVRNLEEVVIRTLSDYGIESGIECGLTGVWVPTGVAQSLPSVTLSEAKGRGGLNSDGDCENGNDASRRPPADKIAAIGVRVSRPGGAGCAWVTTHGLALNVDVDLAWFERIVPCGISDRGVTSMARLLEIAPSLREVADRLAQYFGVVFTRTVDWTQASAKV